MTIIGGPEPTSRRQAGGCVGDVRVVLHAVQGIKDVLVGHPPIPSNFSTREAAVAQPFEQPAFGRGGHDLDDLRQGMRLCHDVTITRMSARRQCRIMLADKLKPIEQL